MAPEVILNVRVTPRSHQNELLGWQDDVLRIRLKAPPVDGKANEALCRYLADLLDLPAGHVTIAGGQTSRTKRVRISGLAGEELRARLAT